ncbi:MAG TPA: NRDE family protein, partial [Salinisphaeraceae bacterium]|nr:NRDE family protein [Salinisphaeraceae bacterium]
MCLITFAWQMHAHYDLIMAANRDEFFARPSSAAHWWTDASGIYGGRDERAGGAWCAADTSGRIAAVTNVHTAEHDPHWRSRGWLVQAALGQNDSLTRHAAALGEQKQAYGPFNLLLAEQDELLFLSNRGQQQQL